MRAIYALSTGRCGTMTLANILNLSATIKCWHEPEPTLHEANLLGYIKHPMAMEIYRMNRDPLVEEARVTGHNIYGETGPRMTFFANEVESYFKGNAKYIHLIRSKDEVVRSRYIRGAYSGNNRWDGGNILPLDVETTEAWWDMTRKEKIEWSWEATNLWIWEFLRSIPADRGYVLEFEDLISGNLSLLEKIFKFVGVSSPPAVLLEHILEKKMNALPGNKLEEYDKGDIE